MQLGAGKKDNPTRFTQRADLRVQLDFFFRLGSTRLSVPIWLAAILRLLVSHSA
jgi:hypothetical protein